MKIAKPFYLFHFTILFKLCCGTAPLSAQSGSWQLWASGLQAGTFPRLAIAPNHDIFYTLIGAGAPAGTVYKANTLTSMGTFTALPAVPLPASHVNNIQCIETNINNEPLVGIFRNTSTEPWLFRFNNATQQWVAATTSTSPTLGAFTMKRGPNNDIWVGAKWANVYRSTDNGNTYTGIDETASVQSGYPCYYPSWYGYNADGAIYGVNVDNNGRVYAGTESAGVVYSDNNGTTWHPADFYACKASNPLQKDSNSVMRPLSEAGNVAGLGFTAANNLVWTGTNMWAFNGWTNEIGFANMTNHTVTITTGIPAYLITLGQQVSKIVTTANGQMFLHSGGAAGASGIGIYFSTNGINWSLFNTGITGLNDNQTQGSLAVDGNDVFMATHDGKIFKYTAVALPLELLHFAATASGSDIVLRWQTANEKNTDYFDIERSADGIVFTSIGQIRCHQPEAYQFTDRQPLAGTNYYRLKMADTDRQFTYSPIVSVDMGKRGNVTAFPNPFTDQIRFTGESPVRQVKAYNTLGQLVFETSDSSSGIVDTGSWEPGLYMFQAMLENGKMVTLQALKH